VHEFPSKALPSLLRRDPEVAFASFVRFVLYRTKNLDVLPDLCTFRRSDSCVNQPRIEALQGGGCKLLIIQANLCIEFYAQICKK